MFYHSFRLAGSVQVTLANISAAATLAIIVISCGNGAANECEEIKKNEGSKKSEMADSRRMYIIALGLKECIGVLEV